MSGGFFRGTSADQDTRFSNKQAKLLKSQKFPRELENLVDMTKVKMDVMMPWIAKRVTELIGFEDEVLINFIYGLLEGKAVNGKQVQISLTGFMERNTGKFMKELWVLLLSAQQNVSGVPQVFLDAKKEETNRRMAETDRIANEIQRKKEKEQQDAEQEKTKMDDDGSFFRDKKTEPRFHSWHDAGIQPEDDNDKSRRNGEMMKSRVLHTPDSSNRSPPRRKQSTSLSKSSGSKRKSRSRSRARSSRSPSVSFQGKRRSSREQSVSPYRKHAYRRSPSPRHRSSYSKRKLTSNSAQYTSNYSRRNRSRTPVRYRSRSPYQHRSRRSTWRSPARYRSRTPLRRNSRSPAQKRSLSPVPLRSTSPRRKSPVSRRRKIQSPEHGTSLSALPHRPSSQGRRHYQDSSISPALHRSAYDKRSSTPVNGRSSPQDSKSPVNIVRRSPSRVKRESLSVEKSSDREKARIPEKHSPAFDNSPDSIADALNENHRGKRSVEGRPIVSPGSPHSGMLDQRDSMKGQDSSLQKSHLLSDASRGRNSFEERSAHLRVRKDDNMSSDLELEAHNMLPVKYNQKDKNGSVCFPSEEIDEVKEKKKRKNSDKYATDSDDQSSIDSYEERKKAKKRRKERKQLKRDDRRRRREEKHQSRDERKLKSKLGIQQNVSDEAVRQQDPKLIYASDTEREQRKLEIELREKAIESLRAKKSLGNSSF